MKRDFDKISDDEWERHSFQPSRVFGQKPNPCPIESFAYKSQPRADYSDQSSDDCVEISHNPIKLDDSNLEDDDAEVEEVVPVANRSNRRFVVEDDEDDCNVEEVFDVKSSEEEEFEDDDDDVVGQALQKCAKISADLRKAMLTDSEATQQAMLAAQLNDRVKHDQVKEGSI